MELLFYALFRKLSFFLNVKNLLAAVVATNLAYAVGLEHFVTSGVRALYKTGECELAVVGSSLVSTSCGNFFLRYCHVKTSSRTVDLRCPIINKNIFKQP